MNQQTYRVQIAQRTDSFYDPETNVHVFYYKPVASFNHLSSAIKQAVASGKLIDLNQNILKAPQEESVQQEEAAAEEPKEEVQTEEAAPQEEAEEVQEEKKDVPDFDSMNGKEMKEFMEAEGIDLDLPGNARVKEIRQALKDYFA